MSKLDGTRATEVVDTDILNPKDVRQFGIDLLASFENIVPDFDLEVSGLRGAVSVQVEGTLKRGHILAYFLKNIAAALVEMLPPHIQIEFILGLYSRSSALLDRVVHASLKSTEEQVEDKDLRKLLPLFKGWPEKKLLSLVSCLSVHTDMSWWYENLPELFEIVIDGLPEANSENGIFRLEYPDATTLICRTNCLPLEDADRIVANIEGQSRETMASSCRLISHIRTLFSKNRSLVARTDKLLKDFRSRASISIVGDIVDSAGMRGDSPEWRSVQWILNHWGIDPERIDKTFFVIGSEDTSSVSEELLPYLEFIQAGRTKERVFKDSEALEKLKNPQAFVTINSPQLARDLYAKAIEKAPKKADAIYKMLVQKWKRCNRPPSADDFDFYADEIIDGLTSYIKGSKLKSDPALIALMAQARYSGDARVRYVKREEEDLSIGDKTGDCTARGSVNFGNSLTWHANPMYSMLELKYGKRFIGRLNFTVGTVGHDPALIVDAIEFNPQAKKDGPYQGYGITCLRDAVSFLLELAEGEGRALYVSKISNSTEFTSILKDIARARKLSSDQHSHTNVQLALPGTEIAQNVFGSDDISDVQQFYQMVDMNDAQAQTGTGEADRIVEVMEREIFNPSQIEYPDVAAHMREREFEEAAKLLVSKPGILERAKKLVGLPVGWKFLSSKMEEAYRVSSQSIQNLEQGFLVQSSQLYKVMGMRA